MPETGSPSFYLLRDRFKLSPEEQVELLLAFAQDIRPAFQHWLAALETDLATLTKEPDMPVTHTSDLDAFFDRDLARRHISILENMGPGTEDATGTLEFNLDAEYLTLLNSVLVAGKTIGEEPHNAILGGYYTEQPFGTILIMLMNGDASGAPYVDAVLILPQDTPYRDVPNISLEPRQQLAGKYVFDYPDGTRHAIGLVSN